MSLVQGKIELGEKLLGGDKSEAIFAARLLWGEATICPLGQKKHLDVAGQKFPRDSFLSLNCLAIALNAGVILKEKTYPLLWARDSLGGILGDNVDKGNCESKIVSTQWGDTVCRGTSRCLAGPNDLPLSL